MNPNHSSWGRYPKAQPAKSELLHWKTDALPTADSMLPYGLGRSYGDSCQNNGGTLLDTSGLDRGIHFDTEQGTFACEAGMSFADILTIIVPQGWFLPVTPGTKFITVGGAIANDIHGKNHHRAGTFGRHIKRFELLRSNNERFICSADQHTDLFRATIGGLGLTGLVTWAEFSLKKIDGPLIDMESIRFEHLDEFFVLSEQSDASHEYTVAWLDATAPGKKMGRGHFLRGNHSAVPQTRFLARPQIPVPFDLPSWMLNRWVLRIFNTLYFQRQQTRIKKYGVHYEPFFYPLDALSHWNRLYGKTGFVQYQCVIPFEQARLGLQELFDEISHSKLSSFLSVLKCFGTHPSPGIMSFPAPGVTLALDFRMEGSKTLEALERLDKITLKHGGRIYPAKDARMSGESFRTFFPQWKTFQKYIDPKFSSSFWRRMNNPSV